MMKTTFALFFSLGWSLLLLDAQANNLSITNLSLVNVTNGSADIQFDLSWDNSWRTSWSDNGDTVTVTNWDAAWVFAKFRQSGGLWKHVMLTESNHTATGGTVIDVAMDDGGTNLGAFVYRPVEGAGSVTCEQMRLHWNYAASGLSGTNDVDIAVMGIEMVYIPEGPFSLGSGGTEYSHFYQYPMQSQPFLVTNAGPILVDETNGALYATGDVSTKGIIPSTFPNGYQALYCMKHELTEGAYVDFLNMLDPSVAPTYYPNIAYGAYRLTIHYTNGLYATDAPDRPCCCLRGGWKLTYLDWSGLRPMTELEFEKIARGVKTPWINEYAWGNSSLVALTGLDGVDGSGEETALPVGANVHIKSSPYSGPVRAGIFATANSSNRFDAGAGYYGVLDLSGSLWEPVVSVARTDGRDYFFDEYGDGNEYTLYPWYTAESGNAYGLRGGGYHLNDGANANQATISARNNMDGGYLIRDPSQYYGIRGVRTAP